MDDDQPAPVPAPPAAGPQTQDLDRPRAAPLHTRALAVIRSMPRIFWRTIVKSWDDSIIGQSAQAAFWQTLSLPPLLLGLLGLTGYVANLFGPDTINVIHDKILSFSTSVFTDSVVQEIIGPMVDGVLREGRFDIVSIGFIIALWAGSSALSSFVDSICMAHDQHTVRNPVHQRFFAVLLYIEFLVIAVLTLPLVALGPTLIVKYLPASWHPAVGRLIDIGYLPFVVALLVGALALLYRQALPRPLPWYRQVPGAAFAALIFLVASTGLRVYLSVIATRGYSYGALATPIAFLLFTFFLGFAVMVGAEFNAALQARWPAREVKTDQLREWVTGTMKEVGIDNPGRVAAEGLRRATDPIRRPKRKPDPEPLPGPPPGPPPEAREITRRPPPREPAGAPREVEPR
ncbi:MULTISPECIES: YihY/virulence factor BrkB family protein [Tsukamurella]|uniref:YihY/virulence factor BrkB family protein n=1 Tax=Tsukamurella strandjordii TaxID=147577 RepID=A0AA90NFU4_9ACTN|nr:MULTISPECIES: YihY/virulence factor BrkB family protein [Tsukamurella]MDP0397680.1 YihY/virulence factor BrkB family protein [Tsukamurella strandjordii]GIZ99121.1 putative ribonuclease BN [Tsukamurella sp. TY48]